MAKANLLAELPFDLSRKPEGLLLLERKASDLGMLILFDGDMEGSPTPVTSGQDKVMFGIQVIDAPAINGTGPSAPFAY